MGQLDAKTDSRFAVNDATTHGIDFEELVAETLRERIDDRASVTSTEASFWA